MEVGYKKALKNLGLSNKDRTLPSMKIPLLPHQVSIIISESGSLADGDRLSELTGRSVKRNERFCRVEFWLTRWV